MKIFIKQNLPYINKGEYSIPFEIVDEKLATQLVVKGLADLTEGELPSEEKRALKKHKKLQKKNTF